MGLGDRDDLAGLAVAPGQCARCRHLEVLRSPRSVFVRCGLAAADSRFARYPALPVLRCAGFVAVEAPAGPPAPQQD